MNKEEEPKSEEPKQELSKLTEIKKEDFLLGCYKLNDYWCSIRSKSQDLFYEANKAIVQLGETVIKSQELENMGFKVTYYKDENDSLFFQYETNDRHMGFDGMVPGRDIPKEKPPFELSPFTDPTCI